MHVLTYTNPLNLFQSKDKFKKKKNYSKLNNKLKFFHSNQAAVIIFHKEFIMRRPCLLYLNIYDKLDYN